MSDSNRFAGTALPRMLRAAGYERAALAIASDARSGVGGELEHVRYSITDPRVRFLSVGLDVGGVVCTPLLDYVDGDDLEVDRRPLLGAHQRDAHVDRVE